MGEQFFEESPFSSSSSFDSDDDEDDEFMCEGDAKRERWMEHYSSSQRILLVGEGDFSFSLCLAKAFGSARNMVATSIDTQRNFSLSLSFSFWFL